MTCFTYNILLLWLNFFFCLCFALPETPISSGLPAGFRHDPGAVRPPGPLEEERPEEGGAPFLDRKKTQHLNKRPSCLEGGSKQNQSISNIYICTAMIPLLSTCKTPCHLPVTPQRQHLPDVEASSVAFCLRCGPNVWLATLQTRMRSCVCMACVDAPRLPWGFCILPRLLISMLSHNPATIF